MTDITVETTSSGAVVVLPRGRLDMTSGSLLREHLRTQVQNGNTRLVVDLAGVDLIDSAGLSALIAGLKAARQAGGSLHVTNPSTQVLAVMQLTNLQWLLDPVESADGDSV
ncbi:MAG: anti-sigma factor antagonist [Mycobacterium sp.]|nr:MAG: anti-sigma factor antagonist [Mycobacterium sp.]